MHLLDFTEVDEERAQDLKIRPAVVDAIAFGDDRCQRGPRGHDPPIDAQPGPRGEPDLEPEPGVHESPGGTRRDILLNDQRGVAVVDQRGQPAVASQNEGLELIAIGEVQDQAAAIPEDPHRSVVVTRMGGRGVDLRFQPEPAVEVQAQPTAEHPARCG